MKRTGTPIVETPRGRPPIVRLGPRLRSPLTLALGCHGNPDRCLQLGARRTPICARCVGILGGNLAALPLFALHGFPGIGRMALAATLLLPAALDGMLQATTRYRSTNLRRLTTGLAAGLGQALLAVGLLAALLGLPAD